MSNQREPVRTQMAHKIVLLGAPRVGKTSIAQALSSTSPPAGKQAAAASFSDFYSATIGVEFFPVGINVRSKASVEACIWDIAGKVAEDGRLDLLRPYLSGSPPAVGIVFDGTSPIKQEEIDTWVVLAKRHAPDAFIYFFVNKVDDASYKGQACDDVFFQWNFENTERSGNVDSEGGERHAIPIFSVSAKTNTGITEAFQTIAEDIELRLNPASSTLPQKNVSGTPSPLSSTLPQKNVSGTPSPQENTSGILQNHKAWLGINAGLIVAAIVLLLLAAFVPPVGAALALGGLSALAVAGITGGGALVLWNIGYVGVNAIKKRSSVGEKEGESPVSDDLSKQTPPSTSDPRAASPDPSFGSPVLQKPQQPKGEDQTKGGGPGPPSGPLPGPLSG